ncbi:MAG: PSP1 domain-containing protein [Lachnospiraceae bacterium]|jgi:cell fate regulator YaaT (PSP1 superfamily)
MVKVIGVRFKPNGKIYYFNPEGLDIKITDSVIVETVRGIEFGSVAFAPKEIKDDDISAALKPVIRIATEEDHKKAEENREKEKKAFDVCLEKIEKHGLDMKLVSVEYTFDGNKILFYFTADGRVDFRELVKDLAGIYRTRIELRQIGVRDETKAMGGIGVCGREFCCHTFQSDFQPVTIRMAKDQNLSLNPTKIYGACGRLMCCIRYEEETYKELNKSLPRVGDETTTEDGYHGVVSSVNILRQKIKVLVDVGEEDREMREYDAGKLKFRKKNKGGSRKQAPTPEELQILEDIKRDSKDSNEH